MKKNSKSTSYMFVIIIVLIILMFMFSLICPFQLWDTTKRIIDYDKLLVLRVFWGSASLINFFLCLYSTSKKVFPVIFGVFFIYGAIKFIGLLII